VIATEEGAVAALDARTGALRWHAQFPGAVRAAPVATNDAVAAVWFDPAGPTLRVLDLATGAVRWDAPMPGGGSAPALAGDLVVAGTGERMLVARRWSDGAEVWRVPTAAGFEPQQRPALIAVHGQVPSVVAADHRGGVVAVDAVTGSVRWTASLGATEVVLRGAPVGAGDLVLITAEGRRLAALQLADGRPVALPDPGGYVAGLAASRGRTVLGLRLTDPGRIEAWRW
jgi:outer membrane protein assembly factor BamB